MSGAQRVQVQCIELSSSLLPMFEGQEQRTWHDIVTLDESWFYHHYRIDHELIWLPWGDKVPEKTPVTGQLKHLMVTIVWSPPRFPRIQVLPTRCRFNSLYYQSEIFEPFSEWAVDTPAQQVEHQSSILVTRPRTQQRQWHHNNSWNRTGWQEPLTHLTRRAWHPLIFVSWVA
jgi:hypothetical protein